MHFVIVGGGPAGNSAATAVARLGGQVTLIERDLVGGAAHLWDCIPSKAMVADGNALASLRRARAIGIDVQLDESHVDMARVSERIRGIWRTLNSDIVDELTSQGVRLIDGEAQLVGERKLRVEHKDGKEETIQADAILLSAGSRPRVPEWVDVDGERILTSRQAYDLPQLPEHVVIVGSGVTGVEFVHIFSAFGCEVTLVASRRHVLPGKDPEVAYALEEELVERGVNILKGARAKSILRDGDSVVVDTQDGRQIVGSHALLAIGSVPNTDTLGLGHEGVKILDSGHIPIDQFCQTNIEHIYAAGDVADKMPLSSVASAQGRVVGYHAMGRDVSPIDYGAVAQAIFTDPEIADVGIVEADAFSRGRKIWVTKVPFSANPKALIEGYRGGFVKILSDPLTKHVLGGSVVGHNAAELISVLSLAVRTGLHVTDLVETLNVHPSLSESLSDAAE